MTLMKLAELTGLSVATVSKAFSGSREISDRTRERVFEAARELGCFDKYHKAPRERPIIALIFPESESEYYGREIGLLEREIYKRGADTVIALTRFNSEREARIFSELAYHMKVDGVILSGNARLIKNPDDIPLVVMTKKGICASNADVVIQDYASGMTELISLIKEYGHKEVGFIGERLTTSKLDHFKGAMRRGGLPIYDKFIVTSKERFASAGEDGVLKLLERGVMPSVLVAAYDQIAFGAIKRLKSEGYRIPEDISVVGMDDLSVNGYFDVPLTSLHIHIENVCRSVVDLIFKRMDNRYYRERTQITIPVSVNLQRSLGKSPEKANSK